MEQEQLQTYEGDTGFNPTKQVDLIAGIDRVNSRLNAADEAALAQVQRNNKTRVENSKLVGQDLIALSKMSKTLTDALVERQKEINEDERLEGSLAGQEAAMAGTLDLTKYDEGMAEAKQVDNVVQDIGAELLSKDPNNYEAVSQLTGKTTWRSKGFREGYYGTIMTRYSGDIDSMVSPTDYQDSASFSQARTIARKAFFKKYGLQNASTEFLAKTVYPKIAAAEEKALSNWQRTFAINDSGKSRVEYAATLAENKDVHSYLNAVRNTVDGSGNPLGFAGAWKQFDTEMIELRKAGMISDADIENMKTQPIPGDPKGRTYGQLYAAKFENIQRQVAAQVRTDFNNSEADRKMEFQKAEQEFVDAYLADPDGFTDEQIDDAIAMLEKTYGMSSSELNTLKNTTVDAEVRKEQERQIKDLLALNLLTPERLKNFDPKLQTKYLSQAQAQAKLAQDNNQFKTENAAIKDLVENAVNLNRDAAASPFVGLMVAKMQQEYQRRVTQLAIAQDSDPAGNALRMIIQEFETKYPQGNNNKKNLDAYKAALFTGPTPTTSEAKARINGISRVLTTAGADALDTHMLFTESELKKITKGYGKPGFTTGATADFIAQQLGVDPLTVINKQLELSGMEALPPSPAMEIINNVTPEQKQLLLKYQTPERSTRGLATDGYKPEIVPKGYGEMIQQSAAKYGIPPSIIAGLIETESAWNSTAVSRAGARGLAQFMPATAAEFGVRPNDPQSAIDGAGKYLKYLLDYFNGDMRLAIFAYNGGMGNIERYGGPIPGSQENQEYYGKVMAGAYKYGYGKQSLQDPGLMRPSIAAQMPS